MKNKRICEMPGIYLKNKTEGVIEYKVVNIEENDMNKSFLVASGDKWSPSVKDKVIFKIIDTGNGIKIGKKYKDTVDEDMGFEYHNIEYFRILLNYNNLYVNHMPEEYNVIIDTSEVL